MLRANIFELCEHLSMCFTFAQLFFFNSKHMEFRSHKALYFLVSSNPSSAKFSHLLSKERGFGCVTAQETQQFASHNNGRSQPLNHSQRTIAPSAAQ